MFDFKNLFVLDMANNHQGDLKHALSIINETSKITNNEKIKAAIKLQFRDLETFIHEDFINDDKNKNIKRFLSTKLSWDDYKKIKDEISKSGLLSMCTPFDENSVDKIVEFKFDLIKIASCSADDWPLLEKVSETGMPTIISTGGLAINEIDKVVSFFEHKGTEFALMHCVSIYPMPSNKSDLAFIKTLKERYSNITIGWSTHEDPDDLNIIKIAHTIGARIYERHIGIETKNYKLNKYSSNPIQLRNWIQSLKTTTQSIGNRLKSIDKEESEALHNLKRGVYLKKDLKSGTTLSRKDVFFAIPLQKNNIEAGSWNSDIRINQDLRKNQPLLKSHCINFKKNKSIIKESIYEIKAILNQAKIKLNPEFEVEFSHHYGVDKFNKFGATIINCINREYCKKILVQTSGQRHPPHYHKKKEETFHLLYGDLEIAIDGKIRSLDPGETCLVLPGVWHSFKTINGAVIEEISTTHYKNDSVYKDPRINSQTLSERKTIVPNWGRYFI